LILCIADVLGTDDLRECAEVLAAARFVDGRATAGWHARLVKHNLQADRGDAALDRLRGHLEARLLDHPLVRLAARPKALTPLILSRYEPAWPTGPTSTTRSWAGCEPTSPSPSSSVTPSPTTAASS
jgi:PKHD-type hydroxylase